MIIVLIEVQSTYELYAECMMSTLSPTISQIMAGMEKAVRTMKVGEKLTVRNLLVVFGSSLLCDQVHFALTTALLYHLPNRKLASSLYG